MSSSKKNQSHIAKKIKISFEIDVVKILLSEKESNDKKDEENEDEKLDRNFNLQWAYNYDGKVLSKEKWESIKSQLTKKPIDGGYGPVWEVIKLSDKIHLVHWIDERSESDDSTIKNPSMAAWLVVDFDKQTENHILNLQKVRFI